jgi:hypothetical protein
MGTVAERNGQKTLKRGIVIGRALLALVGLISYPRLLFGSDRSDANARHLRKLNRFLARSTCFRERLSVRDVES